MRRARAVLARGLDAAGGLAALEGITSLSTDRALLRTAWGQGLYPGAPSRVHGVLLTRLDLRAARAYSAQDLEIDGGQIWGSGVSIAPAGGFDLNFANRTYTAGPATAFANDRAALLRQEVPTLLLAAWRRPETLRFIGRRRHDGRECAEVSYADVDGSVTNLCFDDKTYRLVVSGQASDDPTRGDLIVTSTYTQYRRAGALVVPYLVTQDGPGPERWENRLTRFAPNEPLPDSLFRAPEGFLAAVAHPGVSKVAEGVYAFPLSTAVEFRDFVLVFEAYGTSRRSEASIAQIQRLMPGKPIKYVVVTHFHDDHVGGVRPYVARGVTVLTTPDAAGRVRDVVDTPHRVRPDTLSRAPRPVSIESVATMRVVDDGTRRLELYQMGPTAHVRQLLVGYLPRERVLLEGDMLDIPGGRPAPGGDDTADFARKIEALHLDADQIVPIHGNPGTHRDLERALQMHRARAHCTPVLLQRLACNLEPDRN